MAKVRGETHEEVHKDHLFSVKRGGGKDLIVEANGVTIVLSAAVDNHLTIIWGKKQVSSQFGPLSGNAVDDRIFIAPN